MRRGRGSPILSREYLGKKLGRPVLPFAQLRTCVYWRQDWRLIDRSPASSEGGPGFFSHETADFAIEKNQITCFAARVSSVTDIDFESSLWFDYVIRSRIMATARLRSWNHVAQLINTIEWHQTGKFAPSVIYCVFKLQVIRRALQVIQNIKQIELHRDEITMTFR